MYINIAHLVRHPNLCRNSTGWWASAVFNTGWDCVGASRGKGVLTALPWGRDQPLQWACSDSYDNPNAQENLANFWGDVYPNLKHFSAIVLQYFVVVVFNISLHAFHSMGVARSNIFQNVWVPGALVILQGPYLLVLLASQISLSGREGLKVHPRHPCPFHRVRQMVRILNLEFLSCSLTHPWPGL